MHNVKFIKLKAERKALVVAIRDVIVCDPRDSHRLIFNPRQVRNSMSRTVSHIGENIETARKKIQLSPKFR